MAPNNSQDSNQETEFPTAWDQYKDSQGGWDRQHHQKQPHQGKKRAASMQGGIDHHKGIGHNCLGIQKSMSKAFHSISVAKSLQFRLIHSFLFSPNSLCYRGSYFKSRSGWSRSFWVCEGVI